MQDHPFQGGEVLGDPMFQDLCEARRNVDVLFGSWDVDILLEAWGAGSS